MTVGGGEALFLLLFLVVGVAGTVVWIWALVDAIRVPEESMFRAGNRLIWVLVIVFGHLLGAIAYLAIGRPDASTRRRGSSSVPPPPPPR
ncbi:MAG: PLD nuclease N-terminal domain-containing protein [Actinomycetota bacterium]